MKKKFRRLGLFLLSYSILIVITVSLRLLHGLSVDIQFYTMLTSVIVVLFILLNFTKASHIENILPKDNTLSFIVVLARRFLPIATMRVHNIKENQQMRGAKFTGLNQFRNYLSLMLPSMISTMRWSDNLSESITMRTGESNEDDLPEDNTVYNR